MRNDLLEKQEQIKNWIAENQSKAFMCKQLQCKQATLNSYLNKLGIKYSGNQPGKGIKTDPKRKSAIEYSQKEFVKSHLLKVKLLEDGLKKYECEQCKNIYWNEKPIPLELHHKDGNHFNNNIENIQLLCPNCHAQCDNNSGKGIRPSRRMA